MDRGNVKQNVLGTEKNTEVVERSVKDLEVDVDGIGKTFEGLKAIVENLDYSHHKNNLKIHGLKENIEGQDLAGYLIICLTAGSAQIVNLRLASQQFIEYVFLNQQISIQETLLLRSRISIYESEIPD